MGRAIRLIAILTVLVAAVTAASAGPATADAPHGYFVDESKLPFAVLPGIATTCYWGIQNGAGYRIEVPQIRRSGLSPDEPRPNETRALMRDWAGLGTLGSRPVSGGTGGPTVSAEPRFRDLRRCEVSPRLREGREREPSRTASACPC